MNRKFLEIISASLSRITNIQVIEGHLTIHHLQLNRSCKHIVCFITELELNQF